MEYNCELNNKSCIYKIDFPNGQFYIGKTNNLERRIKEHISDSFNPNRGEYNTKVGRHIRKYFKEAILNVLEYVDVEQLNEKEIYYIELYKANILGCNMTSGGDGSNSGELSQKAVFTNEQVYNIRKRRFNGERKINVYQDYSYISFDSFENV